MTDFKIGQRVQFAPLGRYAPAPKNDRKTYTVKRVTPYGWLVLDGLPHPGDDRKSDIADGWHWSRFVLAPGSA